MPGRLNEAVAARRQALGQAATHDAIWGLALSGGGIRSATFGLGLISALARGGTLARIDLLSTVSGGGYIGGFLGRLFTRLGSAAEAAQVHAALADPNGLAFMRWLRANGSYLLPRGAADRTQAVALYLRNLVAVHLELGLVALLLGTLLVACNLQIWLGVAALGLSGDDRLFDFMRLIPGWMPTTLWLLLPPLAWLGALLACAYWTLTWLHRPAATPTSPWWLLLIALALGAAAWGVGSQHDALVLPASPRALMLRRVLFYGTTGLLLTGALASLLNLLLYGWRTRGDGLLRATNQLTSGLAHCLQAGLLLMLLGAVDKLAWWLAFQPGGGLPQGAWLGAVALAGRALLPLASGLTPRQLPARLLATLGSVAGYALTFVLVAWWVSLVYRIAVGALWGRTALDITAAHGVLAAVGGLSLAYLVLTLRNVSFLNASSLHSFYRARLARSYLGASNADRLGAAPLRPRPVDAGGLKVSDVHPGDDQPLGAYQPHLHGGPVHLINVCVNETRNPVGDLFNRDRRGRLMTVAGGGMAQVPGRGWHRLSAEQAETVGTWMAISGAAVSPAMGALTRGGMSALLAFAGLRLGYWWQAGGMARPQPGPLAALAGSKTGLLLRETFGAYLGLDARRWLLTDGGHFENTAAYALLQARAELIVVADCGADPQYRFGDLENLLRKARVDMDVDVVMLRARPTLDVHTRATLTPALAQGLARIGTLDDLASAGSGACLALARVHYPGGQRGVLVLVKPNMSPDLPADLANFKAAHPAFPQESTADQFFDEPQWESYMRLGQHLGAPLERPLLEWLVAHVDAAFEPDRATASPAAPAAAADAAPANRRLPVRLAAVAVGASTLGVGAVLTMGVSAWDAWRTQSGSAARELDLRRQALDDLVSQWARALPPAPAQPDPKDLGVLAARVAHHAELLCPGQWEGWYQQSPTAQRIARETLQACVTRFAPLQRPAPCNQLIDMTRPPPVDSASANMPPANCLAALTHRACPLPRYGLYDYSDTASLRDAHPNNPHALRHAAERATADSTEALPLTFAPGCQRPLHPLVIR